MASARKYRWSTARWRRSPVVPILGLLWLTVVTIVIVWQTITYRGIAFSVVELQYAQFGQAFPVLTLIPLIVILGLPGLILLWIRLPRIKKAEIVYPPLVQAVAAERRLLRILTAGAGTMFLVAIAILIFSLFEPDASGPAQAVDARASAAPRDGHASLFGTVSYERTATFEQDVLFLHRPIRFAPVVLATDRPVRYFVEITPDRLQTLQNEGRTVTFDGIIKRNGLPGPIEQLFHYAGFQVETPHYVLLASKTSVRMPLYVMALNALVAMTCLVLLALYQRFRLKKARDVAARAQPVTPTTS